MKVLLLLSLLLACASVTDSFAQTEPPSRPWSTADTKLRIDFDSATLTHRAARDLDRVAAALADVRMVTASIVLEGHTDPIGNPVYNLGLSQPGVDAVVTYLVGRGIARDRLQAVGHGANRPLAEYSPTDGRQRRVEIVRLFR